MAIKKTQKVSFRGPLSELRKIIEELKSTGAFELSTFKRGKADLGEGENTLAEGYAATLARVNAALDFAKNAEANYVAALKDFKKNFPSDNTFDKTDATSTKHLFGKRETLSYAELKKIGEREADAMALVTMLENASIKTREAKATIAKNKATIKELKVFESLDTPFALLRDTESTLVVYGLMPLDQLEKFKEDFDLDHVVISEFKGRGEDVGVVMVAHKDEKALVDSIFEYQFKKSAFDFDLTATEQSKILSQQNERLEQDYVSTLFSSILGAEDIKLLQQFHDFMDSELDTENILATTIKTKDFYVLNGWIPADEKKKVAQLIKQLDSRIKIKFGRTVRLDAPPSIVGNGKLIAPYQAVTNMYGSPGKNDMDPNPFVAIFYFLFFGMMVADIGYGLVLFIATGAILLFKKPQSQGVKNLIMILCMAGVSTILWGVFFGGFFGFGNSDISFVPRAVINPIDDAILLLALAMGLGMLHIAVGICLKFYNLLSQGKVADAIMDAGFRIVFFLGAFIAIIGMSPGLAGFLGLDEMATTPFLDTLASIGTWVILVSVGAIVLTAGRKRKGLFGKLIGGFSGLYGFVNYFSDILSYARLFGLCLVGAVIAMVANIMGDLFMGAWYTVPIGILVALVFHAFNLGLCLLSAYIHNARLQFIEFFSKFYDGDGSMFMPIGGGLRYTQIKSVLPEIVAD